MTPQFSGRSQLFIMLMDSVDQEFEQGMAGAECPLPIMFGASARRLKDGLTRSIPHSHVCGCC